jgi:copper ion binding protein
MSETTLKIEGMSCQHCVRRVKKAVSALAGVKDAQVEVGSARVAYDETRLKKEDLKRAVEEAGYKVVDS